MKKKTIEEFINESKEIWGDSYDYSQVEYKNSKTKVIFKCKKHNICFTQTPFSHIIMKRQGCPECRKESENVKHNLKAKILQIRYIKEAKLKFHNKFDYSKVHYCNSHTPVTIICPIHGEFRMIFDNHLKSECGCPKCYREKFGKDQSIDKNEFLKRAHNKFGDKFDYTNINYVSYTKDIKIRCKKHNKWFKISPFDHLRNEYGGCPECVSYSHHHTKSALSTEEYVMKARAVWGDTYDYSVTDYQSYKTKINIKCKKHDYVFSMLPQTHLNGHGCPLCEDEERSRLRFNIEKALDDRKRFRERQVEKRSIAKRLLSTKRAGIAYGVDEFLRIAKIIHGDDFDYRYVREDYVNQNTPVRIICKKHNYIFKQTPFKHVRGQGCPKCIGRLRTTESFIQEAKSIYGDYYDYDETVFSNTTKHVIVKCKYHGKFRVSPIEHLRGCGCPKCFTSILELSLYHYLTNNLDAEVIQQQEFSWLKTSRRMPLDLFLPKYNIAIECQGEQHFAPKKGFGGEKAFEVQSYKDRLKFKLCKEHGIKVLYFSRTTYQLPNTYYSKIYTKKEKLLEDIKKIILKSQEQDNETNT